MIAALIVLLSVVYLMWKRRPDPEQATQMQPSPEEPSAAGALGVRSQESSESEVLSQGPASPKGTVRKNVVVLCAIL
jgi:hypothetical protein